MRAALNLCASIRAPVTPGGVIKVYLHLRRDEVCLAVKPLGPSISRQINVVEAHNPRVPIVCNGPDGARRSARG